MAERGVKGAITGNGADFLVFLDLVQKIGEHGAVAPPRARPKVNSTARMPLVTESITSLSRSSSLRSSTEATVPPHPKTLIPAPSTSKFRGPEVRKGKSWTAIVFWRRPSLEVSGTGQSRPVISGGW